MIQPVLYFAFQDTMSFIIFWLRKILFLGTHFLVKRQKINKSLFEWEKSFRHTHICIVQNRWRPCKQAYSHFEKNGTIIFINISSRASLPLWVIIAFGKLFPLHKQLTPSHSFKLIRFKMPFLLTIIQWKCTCYIGG